RAAGILRHTATGGGEIDRRTGDEVARIQQDAAAAGGQRHTGGADEAAVDRDRAGGRIADPDGGGRYQPVDSEQAGVAVVAQQEVTAGDVERADRRDVVGGAGQIDGAGDATRALQHGGRDQCAAGAL